MKRGTAGHGLGDDVNGAAEETSASIWAMKTAYQSTAPGDWLPRGYRMCNVEVNSSGPHWIRWSPSISLKRIY